MEIRNCKIRNCKIRNCKILTAKKSLWLLIIMFVLIVYKSDDVLWADENQEAMIIDLESADQKEPSLTSGKWKIRKQRFFYYENGKKTTGLKEINHKYYYFAPNGIQKTGWQHLQGDYYFFRTMNGAKGWMVKDKTVNGIPLDETGKAMQTPENEAKLNALIQANQIVEKAARPEMEKSEKLKKCFDYLLDKFQYRGSPEFEYSQQWESDYAIDLFEEGHGNCYAFGAAFAFLANAVGYKNCYAVSSGGHGWAEAAGKIYDPTWSLIDQEHSYFAVDFNLSGKDGRPNYKNARKYIAKI